MALSKTLSTATITPVDPGIGVPAKIEVKLLNDRGKPFLAACVVEPLLLSGSGAFDSAKMVYVGSGVYECRFVREGTDAVRIGYRVSVVSWQQLAATTDISAIVEPPPTPPPPPPPPDTGWTDISPIVGVSRQIYVSSSTGNDANNGSSVSPVKTIAKALTLVRDGLPDQVLLRCGDSWTETLQGWSLSGQDATHRFVVATYGSGPRPILRCGANEGLTRGANVHDVAFVGLDFYAHTRDRSVPGYSNAGGDGGIFWLGTASRLLFEDCVFRCFTGNALQYVVAGISFRRCMFLDMWNSGAHSQGIYMGYPGDGTSGGPTGILIEECLFDGCGWACDASLASDRNHSIYLNNACGLDDAIVRNNIILRSSSHAMQVRAGGSCTGNLCVQNPIGIQVGGGDTPNPGGVLGIVTDNVILDGQDIPAIRPLAFGIIGDNVRALTASRNVIAHDRSA